MKYAFVRDQREAFPVGLMCRILGVGSIVGSMPG